MNIDLNSHISLTSNDDIDKICRNFFKRKKLSINHLNYIHKHPDGSVFYLCSNHQWIKHYIINQYMNIGAFENNPTLASNKYVLWDSLDSDDIILKDSRELIHVSHGLTVIQKTIKGVGFFNFGNRYADNKQLNTYINHLDTLHEFICYFYDQTKSLFEKAKTQRIIIQSTIQNLSNTVVQPSIQSTSIQLTEREQECIKWYLNGKNSGEIAMILGISRRTVETHIEHIKLKFNCRNLCQLGYHFATMQFTK